MNSAFFVHNERIESPMGGNLAAFKSQQAATSYLQKYKGELKKWVELIQ